MVTYVTTLEAADDCWTGAEQTLSDALAESTAFQDLMGEVTATDAAAHIYVDEMKIPADSEAYDLEEDLNTIKGYAIVSGPVEEPFSVTRADTPVKFDSQGKIAVEIGHLFVEKNADDERFTDRWFKRRLAQTIDQTLTYLDDNGGLYVTAWNVESGPLEYDEKDEVNTGVQRMCYMTVDWQTIRPGD